MHDVHFQGRNPCTPVKQIPPKGGWLCGGTHTAKSTLRSFSTRYLAPSPSLTKR